MACSPGVCVCVGGGYLPNDKERCRCTWSVWVTAMGWMGVGVPWVGACVSFCFRITALLPVQTLANRLHVVYLVFATCKVGHHFRARLHCTHGAWSTWSPTHLSSHVSPEGRMLQRVWCVWFLQAWLVRALVLRQCLWEHLPSRITTSRLGMVR